jgi:hypothetical protein
MSITQSDRAAAQFVRGTGPRWDGVKNYFSLMTWRKSDAAFLGKSNDA